MDAPHSLPHTSGDAYPPPDAHFLQLRPTGEKISLFFYTDHASKRGEGKSEGGRSSKDINRGIASDIYSEVV